MLLEDKLQKLATESDEARIESKVGWVVEQVETDECLKDDKQKARPGKPGTKQERQITFGGNTDIFEDIDLMQANRSQSMSRFTSQLAHSICETDLKPAIPNDFDTFSKRRRAGNQLS